MNKSYKDLNTTAVHSGTLAQMEDGGVLTPLYMSTAYPYLGQDSFPYPRYFNIPNHEAVAQKVAALEATESGLILSSGMAAISSTLFTFLRAGDHAVFPKSVYGGTFSLISKQLERFGISYSWTRDESTAAFAEAIQPNTKVIYLETPSNPLLKVTDIRSVANLAKKAGIITLIDNTFASPINQTPHRLGADVVIHSATKYLGGHSDITAGAVLGSHEHILAIRNTAKVFGGSMAPETLYMLERSLKTLGIRVNQQTQNALHLAQWLENHNKVARVHYPGLVTHPNHSVAKAQMKGFGAMLSFDLAPDVDVQGFQQNLQLISPVISLGAVETTLTSPTLTSHASLNPKQQVAEGILEATMRLSVGIEGYEDLQEDLDQALNASEL